MIGHNLLFFFVDSRPLPLVSGDNRFHRFLQILLRHGVPLTTDGPQGAFVDDVGQLRARSAGSGPRNHIPIYTGLRFDIPGVYLEDGFPALQIRQLHRNASVEAAGPQQRRIQGFWSVGGGQDDDAPAAVKAVHLAEQLIQRLFPLVVAAYGVIPPLADGVNLVDEYNTGRFFLGLLKKIPHPGGAHAHKHLHKFRAGDREKRNSRLAGHRLGQQSFACARRAHQQRAFGQLGAYFAVFFRVVEKIYQLGQRLFGLVLAGHVGKGLARLGLHINFGVAFAKRHGVAWPHPFAHAAEEQAAQQTHEQKGQHHIEKCGEQGRHLFLNDAAKTDAAFEQPVRQLGVAHVGGNVDCAVRRVLELDGNLVVHQLHDGHLVFLQQLDEAAVIDLLRAVVHQHVNQDHKQQQPQIISQHRAFEPLVLGLFSIGRG